MDKKKDTFLLVPTYSFTVFNYLLAFLAVMLFLVIGICEFHPTPFYEATRQWLWLALLVLYVGGVGQPLARLRNNPGELKVQVAGFSVFIALVLVMGLAHLARMPEAQVHAGMYTILAGFVSTLAVGLGWLIHASISSRTHRRQHTLNILLQSRMSQEYQRNVDDAKLYWKEREEIPEADVVRYYRERDFGKDGEDADKKRNIRAVIYLCNYYEFLAVGIRHGDLDERLLYDCLSYIASNLHEKAKNLLAYARKDDQAVLSEFCELIKRWDRMGDK